MAVKLSSCNSSRNSGIIRETAKVTIQSDTRYIFGELTTCKSSTKTIDYPSPALTHLTVTFVELVIVDLTDEDPEDVKKMKMHEKCKKSCCR